jgi:hypothetical protein
MKNNLFDFVLVWIHYKTLRMSFRHPSFAPIRRETARKITNNNFLFQAELNFIFHETFIEQQGQ